MQNYLAIHTMFRNFFKDSDETTIMETCVTKLKDAYKDNIDILLFKEALIHFLEYTEEEGIKSVHAMHMTIIDGLRSAFLNVEIIPKIFLTILVLTLVV